MLVTLVREDGILRVLMLAEVPPLGLTAVTRHAVKHLLEPLVVIGQDEQVVVLVVQHPIKGLLGLADLAVGWASDAEGCHCGRAQCRTDKELPLTHTHITQRILNLEQSEIQTFQ